MTIAKKIHLGKGATLDVARLLEGRMLLVGMSGSGKSYLVRVICEHLVEQIPTIILDREGEFATLREKYDVVLVGEGGEADTSVATAAKLARILAELGVSAVVNLYALSKQDKRKFVRLFLETLLSLPRSLWRPRILVLDEAHEFAAEGRECESTEAVIRLMDSGRKQGIAGILCTQRFAKLSKDAASEAVNVCIGKIGLDNDLRRAVDTLGLAGKSDWPLLRQLKPGEWFGYGDAFDGDAGVRRFQCASAVTTHPKAGQRHKLVAPAPSKAILKVAADLKDLKQKVEAEASEIEQLRAENKRLRASKPIAAPPTNGVAKVDERALGAARATGYADGLTTMSGVIVESFDQFERDLASIEAGLKSLGITATSMRAAIREGRKKTGKGARVQAPPPVAKRSTSWTNAPSERNTDGSVGDESFHRYVARRTGTADPAVGTGGMQRILMVLAQHPGGLETKAIGLLARMATKGGTFATYMSRLRTNGWVEKSGSKFVATDTGVEALGGVEPLPTGDELRDYWLEWCGDGGQRRLLDVILRSPDGISKDDAAAEANLAGNAGTFSTYLGRLRTANLVETFKHAGTTCLRATEQLR